MTSEKPHEIDPEAILEHEILEDEKHHHDVPEFDVAEGGSSKDLKETFHGLLHKERANHILVMSKKMRDVEHPPFCLSINRQFLEYRTKTKGDIKKLTYRFDKPDGKVGERFDRLFKKVSAAIKSQEAVLVKDQMEE